MLRRIPSADSPPPYAMAGTSATSGAAFSAGLFICLIHLSIKSDMDLFRIGWL